MKKVHDVRGNSGSGAQDREFFTLVMKLEKPPLKSGRNCHFHHRWEICKILFAGIVTEDVEKTVLRFSRVFVSLHFAG